MTPQQRLAAFNQEFPNISAQVNELFQKRQEGALLDWENWCFLPSSVWMLAAVEGSNHGAFDVAMHFPEIAAIGTWRYSQGTYRFSPELFAALIESEFAGDLPIEPFFHLPEWCIYIETPGLAFHGTPIQGFFAHLEQGYRLSREAGFELSGNELHLLLDRVDGKTYPITVRLNKGTLEECLFSHLQTPHIAEALGREPESESQDLGRMVKAAALAKEILPDLKPLISLLLYVCSEEPEIDDSRVPGQSPKRAEPRKTKKGWKFYPPDRPRLWKVGEKIGAELQAAQSATSESEAGDGEEKRTVRTHLRRGHWHGFWLGPRKGERKFSLRWLLPLVVNAQ